jgi:TetR/AcrR family transcriptional repressor of mexJK operon
VSFVDVNKGKPRGRLRTRKSKSLNVQTVKYAANMRKDEKTKSPRQDKRQEVLMVASECFLANGYDGTSINVMAREAGISKESIYRYFGSKEELFLAVVERELQVYRDAMQESIADYLSHPVEEALCQLAESALKAVTADRTMALRRLVFQMAATQSSVGSYYFKVGPEIAYRNIRLILDYHLDHGVLKTTYDVDMLSHYFVSMVLHTITLEKECCIRKRYTSKEIASYCKTVVNDFLKAYFTRK